MKQKSDQVGVLLNFVHQMKAIGWIVYKVRLDNSGENVSFKHESESKGLGILFEFTAPNTPQQNGKVERKFATLKGRARAMLNWAGIDRITRIRLWTEAANCATKYDGILITRKKEISSYEKFYGRRPNWIDDCKKFGEVGVFKNLKKGKMTDNRGSIGMFVGHSDNHPSGTFKMINITTWKAIHTRDVTWLNKSYGEYIGLTNAERENLKIKSENNEDEENDQMETLDFGIKIEEYEGTNDESTDVKVTDEANPNNVNDVTNDTNVGEEQEEKQPKTVLRRSTRRKQANMVKHILDESNTTPQNPRLWGPKKLRSGKQLHTIEELEAAEAMISILDIREMCYLSCDIKDEVEPTTFDEAWNHPDPVQRAKWRDAIKKEFHDGFDRKVYEKFDRADVPSNRRCIQCKWVFKIKRNGRYRARLVAKGFTQRPNEDYDASSVQYWMISAGEYFC